MEAGIYSHIHEVNASMVFKIKEIKVNTNFAKRNNYCQLSTEKKNRKNYAIKKNTYFSPCFQKASSNG